MATSGSEFDVLRSAHKFLRDDENGASGSGAWEDQLAKKYYDSLWKEFAVCDLKHYRSGRFALRWRSEAEVLSGTGERSCGNTRCPLNEPLPGEDERIPGLATLELPFAYEEHGARKSALVKVVLCAKCVRKLNWKREHDKAAMEAAVSGREADDDGEGRTGSGSRRDRERGRDSPSRSQGRGQGGDTERKPQSRSHSTVQQPEERRRRRSRSRSPRRTGPSL